jgi:Mor family transcriptional regulator
MNAKEVLPASLVREIQKYVQGRQLYIPRVERQAWGTGTGIREELDQRNREIARLYRAGVDIPELAEAYCLSMERIRAIIYESETK